jgi:hypothetical protein
MKVSGKKLCKMCGKEFKVEHYTVIAYCPPCRTKRSQNKLKKFHDEIERRKKEKEEKYYGDE